ncbi:MAG: hypothetical protein ACYCQK_01930 [Acidiferrobacteraceae bacterium]
MTDPSMIITEPMKANWAVAYAREHVRRYLNPALRKAYKKDRSAPDADALREAIQEARSILSALERGLEMLG